MSKELQEYFRSILDYDTVTGIFKWKTRPAICKSNNIFNSLFAEKTAGNIHRCKKSKTTYVAITIGRKTYKAHRIAFYIMEGWAPPEVDHIDKNGMNNSWSNLRASCSRDNSKNLPMQKSNRSGHIGVNWHKAAKKWQVRAVNIDGIRVDLGRYDSLDYAVQIRKQYEKEFGYYEHRGSASC